MSTCTRQRITLTAVSLFLVSCSGRAAPQVDADHATYSDHDPRFVGAWLVHEIEAHALYSASVFRFEPDGSLAQTWDAGFYGGTHGYVRDPDKAISCGFSARWKSAGPDLLVIDGDCSDAKARAIRLRFGSDPSMNHTGTDVQIESVGGEPGWLPPAWGWAFKKCRSPDDTPKECGALM